jgi:Zinc dependent phospholipase C
MPDMLAHYEVAQAARARLPRGPLAQLLEDEHDAYKVGAQGPDFLFYSYSWLGRRSRTALAFLLHQHRMSHVFRCMLAHAAGLPPEQRSPAFAFICGYAAHLSLDAEAHPWIMYWTGDITDGASASVRAAAFRRHGLLESSLDVVLRRKHSADPRWLRRQDLLRMTPGQAAVVAAMFERVLADVYDIVFSRAEAMGAFRDMVFVYGSMTDRRSALSRGVNLLGPLIDRHGTLRAQIYPDEPLPAVVNLISARRLWYSPSTPDEPRHETFHDIIDAATAHTLRCLDAIDRVAHADGDLDDAVATIGDRSMFTGLPCDDRRSAVAFAPQLELIWEKPAQTPRG